MRARQQSVLVVEDDEVNRRLLIDYLSQQAPIAIDGARDGVEALHHITHGAYAVVILDVVMPKMSGIDLLNSLKALCSDHTLSVLRATPIVVVVTSMSPQDVPDELFDRSFPDVVRRVFRKPLDLGALVQCVMEHLAEKAES